jgi:epi-isozizaene 5-monooxygenase / beta-farnesene synthase
VNTATATRPSIPKVRTRIWKSFAVLIDEIQHSFERHGDLIELTGFPYHVFCLRDPEQIEIVMKHPVVGVAKCPSVFARLRALMPRSAVVQPGGTIWTDKRQKIQHALSNEAISRYGQIVVDSTGLMLDQRWDERAASASAFDIYDELQVLLTRIGMQIFFSRNATDDELQLLHRWFTTVESEFPRRLPPVLPTRRDAKVRKYSRGIRQFMAGLIAQRRACLERPNDLLSLLLEDQDGGKQGALHEAAIIDQMIELFTSVRLCAPPLGLGLRMLADHPAVQERLREECRTIVGNRPLRHSDLGSLKYHQMVISEVFRLYPSAAALPRWCKDGMTIGEFAIPRRSIVVPMIYHTHRHPRIYPKPEEFLPDRWHPDAVPIHSYARLGFGHGKRTCPGLPLALMTIRTIIGSISQRYRIEYADDTWNKGEVELQIHPSRPIRVRLVPHADSTSDQAIARHPATLAAQ